MACKLKKILLTVTVALLSSVSAIATDYDWTDCQGSAKPYPVPSRTASYPDTLHPVMINHVGRHGARFPVSPKQCDILLSALRKAETENMITPVGTKLLMLVEAVKAKASGRWGALDSLGMIEQRGIASRMITAYPELFKGSTVNAISSYVPRCIMSMDEFTHQLARMDNSVELNIASGRRFSPLVRFFEHNAAYTSFIKSVRLTKAYDNFIDASCHYSPLPRILGRDFNYAVLDYKRSELVMAEFAVLSSLEAMGMKANVSDYLTKEEQNALWGISNMRHYLQHSASALSVVPAAIAAPLLQDLLATTDAFIAGDKAIAKVMLRFGHAETLMPLLALMKLPGCYYITDNLEKVGDHWKDFYVVPMAANLQMILFRSNTGAYYVRIDLNEVPVPMTEGSSEIYVPWQKAGGYFRNCIKEAVVPQNTF